MNSRGRSLRSTFSWTTLVLAVLALVAAITVVALTTFLHRASRAIEASTQSVRIAQEAEIDLLLHAQAKSVIVRRDLSGSMQRKLSQAEDYVDTASEGLLLDEAKARVQEYVLASRDADQQEEEIAARQAAAFTAIEDLVRINVEQARDAAREASGVDYLANIGGLAVAFLVLGLAAFFVYWVRGPLIRPIWELGEAMRQFGLGEYTTRARIARDLRGLLGPIWRTPDATQRRAWI